MRDYAASKRESKIITRQTIHHWLVSVFCLQSYCCFVTCETNWIYQNWWGSTWRLVRPIAELERIRQSSRPEKNHTQRHVLSTTRFRTRISSAKVYFQRLDTLPAKPSNLVIAGSRSKRYDCARHPWSFMERMHCTATAMKTRQIYESCHELYFQCESCKGQHFSYFQWQRLVLIGKTKLILRYLNGNGSGDRYDFSPIGGDPSGNVVNGTPASGQRRPMLGIEPTTRKKWVGHSTIQACSEIQWKKEE